MLKTLYFYRGVNKVLTRCLYSWSTSLLLVMCHMWLSSMTYLHRRLFSVPCLSQVTFKYAWSVTCDYSVYLICQIWLSSMTYLSHVTNPYASQVTFQQYAWSILGYCSAIVHMCLFSLPYLSHFTAHLSYLSHVTVLYALYVTCDCSLCLVSHMWLLCMLYTPRVTVQYALSVTCNFPVWLICHMWLSSMPYLSQVTVL